MWTRGDIMLGEVVVGHLLVGPWVYYSGKLELKRF